MATAGLWSPPVRGDQVDVDLTAAAQGTRRARPELSPGVNRRRSRLPAALGRSRSDNWGAGGAADSLGVMTISGKGSVFSRAAAGAAGEIWAAVVQLAIRMLVSAASPKKRSRRRWNGRTLASKREGAARPTKASAPHLARRKRQTRQSWPVRR